METSDPAMVERKRPNGRTFLIVAAVSASAAVLTLLWASSTEVQQLWELEPNAALIAVRFERYVLSACLAQVATVTLVLGIVLRAMWFIQGDETKLMKPIFAGVQDAPEATQ